MKKHFQSFTKFLLNVIISTILVSVPCIFLFEWIGSKEIVDWREILFIAIGCSVALAATSIFLGRRKANSKIKDILNSITVIATISTIMYGGFCLMEWIFPLYKSNGFTDRWEEWLSMSVSLTVFFHIQDNYRKKKNNENVLVVATGCNTVAEAEKLCAMLESNDIKAMIVEKENPMYIKNDSQVAVQVQVMNKDLQRAKELLRKAEK